MFKFGLMDKIILGIILISVFCASISSIIQNNVLTNSFLGLIMFLAFIYVFLTVLFFNFKIFADHRIISFIIVFFVSIADLISAENLFFKGYLIWSALYFLFLAIVFIFCLVYSAKKIISELFAEPKRKSKARIEYDAIEDFIKNASLSILLISLGFYLTGLYPSAPIAHLIYLIIILIGLLTYLFSRSGKEFLSGLINQLITHTKKFPSNTKSLNVHLGIGWIITIFTIYLTFWIYQPFTNAQISNIDYSSLSNVAMSIMVGESIFVALIATMLGKIKNKSFGLFYLLLIGIASSIIVLEWISFNVQLIFILTFLNFAILSMYTLVGAFIYYVKVSFLEPKTQKVILVRKEKQKKKRDKEI